MLTFDRPSSPGSPPAELTSDSSVHKQPPQAMHTSGRVLSAAPPPLASISQMPPLFRESAARVRERYGDLYHLPVMEYPDGSRSYHHGRLYRCHGLNVLFLRGDFVEMALQHGRLLADQIPQGAIAQSARLISCAVSNALGRQSALANWFSQRLQRYVVQRMLSHAVARTRRILGDVPALEEAVALSDACGVPVGDLAHGLINPEMMMILAQLGTGARALDLETFREADAAIACCSTFAAWGTYSKSGQMIIGHNMDFPLNGSYDRFPTVIYFEPSGSSLRYMSFASAGVHNAGIISYNEAGLFLASHVVPTRDVSIQGSPALVTATQIIRQCKSLDEAAKLFGHFPPPTGWAYTAANTKTGEIATIELSYSDMAVRRPQGESYAQTNHFKSPPMLARNALLNTSVAEDIEGRLLRVRQRVEQAKGRLDAEEAVSILGDQIDPFVGQVRGVGSTVGVHTTLTSVVIDAASQRALVATGPGPAPHSDYLELPLVGTFDRDDFPQMSRRVVRNDWFAKQHPEKLSAVRTFIQAKIAYETDCDPQKAYRLLQEVVREDPSNPAYFFQLGIFALKNRHYDAALDALARVLDRPYVTGQLRRLAHYYRGRVFAHLAKADEAQRELAAVLDDPATDPKLRAAAERAAWRTRVFGQFTLRPRSLSIMMQHSDMLTY